MTVTDSSRRSVAERSNYRCEYCLLYEDDVLGTHEADHIRPLKHHGETILDNLAFACLRRNRRKGTDIAGYDSVTGQLTPLFNPRVEKWSDHFSVDNGFIRALTAQGRVTIDILQLNEPERIAERIALTEAGQYPG